VPDAAPVRADEPGRYLEQLLALSRECIAFTDEHGVVSHASELAAQELGVPRRRLVGKPFASLVALADRRGFRQTLAGAETRNVELTLEPRGLEPFQAVVGITPGLVGWVISFSRVTEPREEPGAVFAQERMQHLLERMNDGIIGVERTGRIEFANRPATTLVGVEAGARLPETWHGFSLRAFAETLFVREAVHAEAVVKLPAARSVQLLGMPTPLRDGAVLLLVEATERERRDQAQREFIANAAHELQTPLTAISAAIDVLQGGAKHEPEVRDRFLAHVARESDRMIRLVRSLLVLARAQELAATGSRPVLLRELLETIAERLEPPPGLRVDVLAPAGLEVVTNEELLEQIVVNLAENAVKYTPSGRVVLSARHRSRGGVAVEVHDTGPGIPEEVRERVFERFFRGGRRGADGFGLGLSVAQQAAEALGGRLELDSVPGSGTTARLLVGEESQG
jgi:two-component system, OmpR family, phosphate regulon sensor histidine kinase PhoR